MTKGKQTYGEAVSTQEWYDFVALVADLAPAIHVGDQEATRTLLEMLEVQASDHVLDVGSGPGITAALIAGEIDARVTGIDISPRMVAKARERAQRAGLAERTHFQVGDVFNLPFDDGTFDAVIFESLLTIIPGDPADALAEIARVLRPGGWVGANEGTIDPAALLEFESLLAQHPAIQRGYTPATLRQQFEQAGFRELRMKVASTGKVPAMDTSSALRQVGCRGLLSFFLRVYPKLAWKLLTDPRFRRAHQVDEQITQLIEEHAGYALIVGQKPA
ncbi:MAG: class I SAM-dependent methyltransferase [Anaerolineae bacterium]|jgi:ubiquinone/menaquinone biosynthesis C-methylase UbiE